MGSIQVSLCFRCLHMPQLVSLAGRHDQCVAPSDPRVLFDVSLHAARLSGFKKHPLRQFLEPFTSRNIQATNHNLQFWFEFRGAEFGLAPLSVEVTAFFEAKNSSCAARAPR